MFLAVLVLIMVGSIGLGTVFSNANWYPKLALDLAGGTEVVLTPELSSDVSGDKDTSSGNIIDQSIEIIRKRIDASGVSEAEVSRQGQNNIVVGIPGHPDEKTLDLVRNSAVLRFRPVLRVVSETIPTDQAVNAADINKDGEISTKPASNPANSWDQAWVTEALVKEALEIDCNSENAGEKTSKAEEPIVSCPEKGEQQGIAVGPKYILGPAAVNGVDLSKATAGPHLNNGVPDGSFAVAVTFNDKGTKEFGDVTRALVSLPGEQNLLAIVIDNRVVSAVHVNQPIVNGNAEISGSFTAIAAKNLANQLSFGALPINFTVHSQEQISSTLGAESLRVGIIAGIVGIAAVLLFILWLYYGLGILAIVSLIIGAVITYFVVTLLSWVLGYRLSLPAVVSIIISIGITADSFIVYFERIKDEIRAGLRIPEAVNSGWKKAIRTILVSDTVNIVAATILYLLAVGGVSGFAFLIGITTIVDLVVVLIFTRPIMEILAKTKFVGNGNRWSGLSYEELGMPNLAAEESSSIPRLERKKKSKVTVDKEYGTAGPNSPELSRKADSESILDSASDTISGSYNSESKENTSTSSGSRDKSARHESSKSTNRNNERSSSHMTIAQRKAAERKRRVQEESERNRLQESSSSKEIFEEGDQA